MRIWLWAVCGTLFVSASWVAGAPTEAERTRISDLLEQEQYERAAEFVETTLPQSEDKSYLYYRLAQVEMFRRNPREAFAAFQTALDCAPKPANVAPRIETVEQGLKIAVMVRVYDLSSAVETILSTLQEKYPENASVLYELSYLKSREKPQEEGFAGFFECYYRAYLIDPNNPRALPGRALIAASIGANTPTPGNFPWLEAAAFYRNNLPLWQNAVATLAHHNLLDDEQRIGELVASLPDHLRQVVGVYLLSATHHDSEAKEAILNLPARPEDFYFDLLRRHLLTSTGHRQEALEGMVDPGADVVKRVLLANLRRAACVDSGPLDEQEIAVVEELVAALHDYGLWMLESEPKARSICNDTLLSFASGMAEEGEYDSAMALLKLAMPYEDDRICQCAAGLSFAMDRPREAVEWLQRVLDTDAPEEPQETVRAILDYSSLLGDANTVNEYLSYAQQRRMTSIVADYNDLQPKLETDGSRHWIRNIMGHVGTGGPQPWNMGPLDICAKGSALSIINYYGKHLSYAEVSDQIDALVTPITDSNDLVTAATNQERFGVFFQNNGLEVLRLLPFPEMAKKLLRQDYPLVLFHNKFGGGMTIGHASVVRGYDDATHKFYLTDISEPGEQRIDYTRLIEARQLFLIAPSEKIHRVRPSIEAYIIPSMTTVLDDEQCARISALGPGPAAWALCRNARALQVAGKNLEALECLEEAIRLWPPTEVSPYFSLVGLYVALGRGQEDAAMKYLFAGLEIQPEELMLLAWQVERAFRLRAESGGIPDAYMAVLLHLTEQMEDINSSYASTYRLRGDLYLLDSKYQKALTAYQQYLEYYPMMEGSWQEKDENMRLRVERCITLCREQLQEYRALREGTATGANAP